jgi:hypothetical protein
MHRARRALPAAARGECRSICHPSRDSAPSARSRRLADPTGAGKRGAAGKRTTGDGEVIHCPEPRPELAFSQRGATQLPRRVEGVLPPHRDAERLSRTRPMDPAAVADGPAQAMEARPADYSRPVCPGSAPKRSRVCRGPRPSLVEDLPSPRPRHRHAAKRVRSLGAPSACHVTSTVRTAGCGPACPVVWERRSGHIPLPPIPIRP